MSRKKRRVLAGWESDWRVINAEFQNREFLRFPCGYLIPWFLNPTEILDSTLSTATIPSPTLINIDLPLKWRKSMEPLNVCCLLYTSRCV